jgi:hypothetical protein
MPLVEDNKKIVQQNRATIKIILDGLQFRLMLWKNSKIKLLI